LEINRADTLEREYKAITGQNRNVVDAVRQLATTSKQANKD